MTNNIDEISSAIFFVTNAKLLLGLLIGVDHLIVFIKGYHPIGHGLGRASKIL